MEEVLKRFVALFTHNERTIKPTALILLGLLCLLNISAQENKKHETTGFLDFNAYYDTREFSVMTINILANLPNRFQYFSFTNFQSAVQSFDPDSFYSEQNLRWQIKKGLPLDLTHQFVMRSGSGNDDFKLGLRWRLNNTTKLESLFKKLNMSYSICPMLVQFRVNAQTKYVTQIEHVYRIKLYKDRVYLGGFADQNFIYSNGQLSLKWVTEHQLGIRIIGQLYAVAEYRLNEFLTSNKAGAGFGLEYKIKF